MTLTTILSITSTKELKRATKSLKEYFFFEVCVFNAGSYAVLTCTDRFIQPSAKLWNGYDCLVVNDDTTQYYIEQELASRKNNL
jgi:hypothetical protein